MSLPTTSQVIGVANTLLQHAGLPRSVHGIEQCGSLLFSQLYEALTGARPPATTAGGGAGGRESEAERCQAVVDAFSEQLSPHISLDHITGRDLAVRDPLTIINLLDIFSVLFHVPSTKKKASQPANDRDDLISDEGLSIVSEVLQEELGPSHSHTHFSSSYSTESTAEILRPVPPSPPLHCHPSHPHNPPSLTVASLTCSTIEPSEMEGPPTGGPQGSAGGPVGPAPFTPPPSQKQLLQSPLHHSTPRPHPTRSRIQSFPLARANLPPATPPLTSPPQHQYPLLSATPPPSSPPHSSSCEDEEEEEDTTRQTATQYPDSTLVEQEHGNETENISASSSPSPPRAESRGAKIGGPSPAGSPERPPVEEEVRREVLTSLYQRYLQELKTSQPTSTQKKRRGRGRVKKALSGGEYRPHGRKTVSRPAERLVRIREDHHRAMKEREKKSDKEGKPQPSRVAAADLFPVVEASLPGCPIATETVRHLWRKQLQQITALTKPTPSHPHTAQQDIEEVQRKHTGLLEAIKKEIEHTRRMRGREESRAQQRAVRSQLQARRQATARARRYFRDYELSLKAKLQKKRTSEEQVFRRVFEDGLALLRERERELRRFAREKRQTQRERQKQQLEAMEQYYNDQFSMLAESLARQRGRAATRGKAQNQLSEQLRRELRERLEREVRQLQDCLEREEDVTHFRELDAQQLRLALHHLLTPSL